MASNFDFLKPEFGQLHEAACRAERYALSDARASAIYARMALESAVMWLYEHDKRLTLPYDTKLGALLHGSAFRSVVPEAFFHKAKAIQKAGNMAVHNTRRPVKQWEALQLVKELFHSLYWLARTYHREPLAEAEAFDAGLVPKDDGQQSATRAEAKLAEMEAELARRAERLEQQERDFDAKLRSLQEEVAAARAVNERQPDTHDYSEADTRRFLIDLDLKRAGWDLDRGRDREYEVSGMPSGSGVGKVDYVLWGADDVPLAVVEAKRSAEDVGRGQQQAKLYADCLEKMHGRRPFIYYTNGYDIYFWDDQDYPPRRVSGYRSREDLEVLLQRRRTRKPIDTRGLNRKIVERYYQERAVASLARSFEQRHRKGLLVMATGTGKTRTAIALVDLLQRCNWIKRALFLADRVSLVNQACNAFKGHLPEASPVNLCTEKAKEGRVFVSTYPTMMGLIDETEDGVARFGPGFFDLVIIDEAHRSVYQRYRAIFEYFDSLLVGLTATPRNEVDRNTYELFELEPGVPSDAYELEEAVRDGFLVPPKVLQVDLRFPREGIRYENLSEEEKRKWESMDWGDGETVDLFPTGIDAGAINRWLFNTDTVDKVLEILMERGHKVEGGDRLAKTIVFARNHNHAAFIEERFNHHFPHLKGSFARVIDNRVKYAQSLIDAFSIKGSDPHLALSVDMLDTGIDVPEVANLVFFKPVYSRIKFWQMIGRGTRLCPNLYGEGQDKEDFRVFDFCLNFEFFGENPAGVEGGGSQPVGVRLFNTRARIVKLLDERGEQEGAEGVRQALAEQLRREVDAMPRENFQVRPRLAAVERFAEAEAWERIDEEALDTLTGELAGLPTSLPAEKIETKQFDYLCYRMELAFLEGDERRFESDRVKVTALAGNLEGKPSVPAIQSELAFLQEVQTSEYWEVITVAELERLRVRLRGLAQFVDRSSQKPLYSDFEDELMEVREVDAVRAPRMTSAQYEKKVQSYLKAHRDSLAVQKVSMNEPLTAKDLASLEQTLVEIGEDDGETLLESLRARHAAPSLAYLVRKMVGMDRRAALELFSDFLKDRSLGESQIRFVEVLVDQLVAGGIVDPGALYDPPYLDLHDEGPDGLFAGREDVIEGVFGRLEEMREKLVNPRTF